MQLLELPQYKDERKRLKDLYDKLRGIVRFDGEVVVAGSTAAKIQLTKPEREQEAGFLATVIPQSGDMDILIDWNTFSKISGLITARSFPILEVNYRSTGVEITYLPVTNYTIGNDVDVFVGKVGVIPADSKAYTSGGSINIDGYRVNAAYKPYAASSWLNPLAVTDSRTIRSVIVLVPEVVEYGKEKLKAEVTEMLHYVAKGSLEVDSIKEELKSKDPNNPILHHDDFINYDENFRKIARHIRASSRKLVKISIKSGQPENEAEQTVETIAAEIENNYDKILREVKR